MIEIRIPKEIRQYKEKAFFGLTWRQIFALVLAGAINIPLYLYLTPLTGADVSSWVVIFSAVPIMMMGFWEPYGMNFEDFLKAVIISMLVYPEKRLYKTENLFEILSGEKEPHSAKPSAIGQILNAILDSLGSRKPKERKYDNIQPEEISVVQEELQEQTENTSVVDLDGEQVTTNLKQNTPIKEPQTVSRPVVIHGLVSIAVFAVSSGAGATTMVIKLAEYFAHYGKTAAIAVDGKIDLSFAKGKADYFIVDGTKLSSIMYELTRDKYKFVITDYGALFDIDTSGQLNYSALPKMRDQLSEFFRSNFKVGMGLSSPWHIDKFKFFMGGEMFADKILDGSYFFIFDKDVKGLRFRYGFKQIFNRADLAIEQLHALMLPEFKEMIQSRKKA